MHSTCFWIFYAVSATAPEITFWRTSPSRAAQESISVHWKQYPYSPYPACSRENRLAYGTPVAGRIGPALSRVSSPSDPNDSLEIRSTGTMTTVGTYSALPE